MTEGLGGGPIVVLGGAGDIGRALVASLLGDGAAVVVLDLPATLERRPPPAPAIPLDIRSEHAVAEAVAALGAQAPRVGGLVNLAGYMGAPRPIAETQSAYFDDILGGNLRGAFLAARAVAPMIADGGGVVMVSSGLAQFVRPGYGAYAAAKAGLIALTKTLAVELAPRLRANAVAPGLVDTAFLHGGAGRSDERGDSIVAKDAYAATVPLARLAQPADVVGPIRFLLSVQSGYMTGQVLWVNGGTYMP